MRTLRITLAALGLAGAIAWPVAATACMASDACPLKAAGGAGDCHGSHAAGSSEPQPPPPQDARDCCDELQAPAAKAQGPTLEPLVRGSIPAVAIANRTPWRPAGRAAASPGADRVRGAPLIALHCTLRL